MTFDLITLAMHSARGIPHFLLYFGAALILLAVFFWAYCAVTPHDELELIRVGNHAASLAISGAGIGYALPLAKSIAQASALVELFLWGIVALAVQLLAYSLVRWLIPKISQRIMMEDMSAGVILAGTAIIFGLINAAAMSL